MFGSGFGLQQFEKKFVHRHTAVLFDTAEVLDSPCGCLTEEREGHDQFASPPWILWVVGDLIVLKGSMEDILESLHCFCVLNLHGVYGGETKLKYEGMSRNLMPFCAQNVKIQRRSTNVRHVMYIVS